MKLVIGAQNVGKGAERMDPNPDFPAEVYEEHRWSKIVTRLKGAPRPIDLLVLNELNGWDEARLADAAADLDMEKVGIAPSRSGYASGFLYRRRPGLERLAFNVDHEHAWHHGGAVAAFQVENLPQPVAVVGAHLWPASAHNAIGEAAAVVYRAVRYGEYGAYAGDFNFAGLRGPAMDRTKMQAHNMMARMRNPPAAFGPFGRARNRVLNALRILPRPDKRPAKTLYDGGLRDAAEAMEMRTRDKSYLAYTCPSARIDIIAATARMTDALVDFWVLNEPYGASDHAAVMAEYDVDKFDRVGLKPYF